MTSKQAGQELGSPIASQGPIDRQGDFPFSQEPCSVARKLMIEFGPEAAGIALARADQALDADDGERFQVWLEIAAAIQDFETRSDG